MEYLEVQWEDKDTKRNESKYQKKVLQKRFPSPLPVLNRLLKEQGIYFFKIEVKLVNNNTLVLGVRHKFFIYYIAICVFVYTTKLSQ